MSYASNLPPGVTESMIPGNRPQDMEAERYADGLDEAEMHDWLLDKELDAEGCVVEELDDGRFGLQSTLDFDLDWPHEIVTAKDGRQWAVLHFDTEDDAVAYALCFHESQIVDAMVQEHLEEGPPEEY